MSDNEIQKADMVNTILTNLASQGTQWPSQPYFQDHCFRTLEDGWRDARRMHRHIALEVISGMSDKVIIDKKYSYLLYYDSDIEEFNSGHVVVSKQAFYDVKKRYEESEKYHKHE